MDVLAAVLDYSQGGTPLLPPRPFAFVELGSGYGHWTFAAHRALQQRAPGAPHHYLLVDVVASLAPAIEQIARLNGVQKNSTTHALHFHVGYASEKNQSEPLEGQELLSATHQMKSYGKLWGTGLSDPQAWDAAMHKPASLGELFDIYGMPRCIDMVDIDIQNNEYVTTPDGRPGLFHQDRSIQILTRRAKRVHIGLHDSRAYDETLIAKFRDRGWRVRWHYPMSHPPNAGQWYGQRTATPFGPVQFNDGVLSLINMRWPCEHHRQAQRHRYGERGAYSR